MRTLACWGALLLCASVTGCFGAEQRPPRSAAASATPSTTSGGALVGRDDVENRWRGVTEAQPPGATQPPEQTPPSAGQRLPPSESEQAPQDRLADERNRVSQAVGIAKQQIDRLTRIERAATPDREAQLDSLLADLQTRREKVLQDMRELELRPPSLSPDRLESDLDRDLDSLQASVHDSYVAAPAPGSGMAPPAPLPP
jgi:hypothetical protein